MTPATVVFVGDSITLGQVSASYIQILRTRMDVEKFHFINAGVNNDVVYNVLHRLEHVVANHPDIVILMIGTNDILSTLSPENRIFLRLHKRLPRNPDLHWYIENLTAVIRKLKNETSAIIGVASIPVLGENLVSRPIRRVKAYNDAVMDVTKNENVAYLPVFENQVEYLKSANRKKGKTFYARITLSVEMVLTHAFFHETFDSFSARHGFKLLTDGVHMNTKGAEIIADVVEFFLRDSQAAG